MAKEKKKKTAALAKRTIELTPEEKNELKAKLKAAKTETAAAIAGKDKKKIKEARNKAKKVNLKLKRVKVAKPPEAKEEAKEKAAE
ncbi:MAG: hypothetical protein ABSG42_04970 [Nitrospirota bacterium]